MSLNDRVECWRCYQLVEITFLGTAYCLDLNCVFNFKTHTFHLGKVYGDAIIYTSINDASVY